MKLALIPPREHLDTLRLTDYQLCLPSEMTSKVYFDAYGALCRDSQNFVILDNGAAEGKLYAWETILGFATVLNVDEVVLPDVIGDAWATIETIKALANERDALPPTQRYMAVVQGQTYKECMETVEAYADMPFVDTVGIPRHLITTLGDKFARMKLASAILDLDPSLFEIHLLGANSSFPNEFYHIPDDLRSMIRGADTSMPFVYALEGERLLEMKHNRSRQPKYFDEVADLNLVSANVNTMIRWVHGYPS